MASRRNASIQVRASCYVIGLDDPRNIVSLDLQFLVAKLRHLSDVEDTLSGNWQGEDAKARGLQVAMLKERKDISVYLMVSVISTAAIGLVT